jgi:methionine-rich copper-binding protein CopC
MTLRGITTFGLASVGLLLPPAGAGAQNIRVLESTPAANAAISGVGSAFSVRFDKPVDHIHSVFVVKRGSEIVETLQPRFQTAPQVLFARAPTLPPGEYKLCWQVRTLTNEQVNEGEIPFTVVSAR